MTPDEHDQRIIAKCRSLLALAAKRTPGRWWNEKGHPAVFAMTPKCRPNGEGLLQVNYYGRYVGKDAYADAAYIAACAGPAEAGWLSTIAAIELCHQLPSPDSSLILARIRAAWPKEIL